MKASAKRKDDLLKKTYYALGWEYESSIHIFLKYLHNDPKVPFKISGIVHNVTYVDAVDNIPLIKLDDFLKMKLPSDAALLPFSGNKEWKNLVAKVLPSPKPELHDLPTFTRQLAEALKAKGISGVEVGNVTFPEVFEGHQRLSAKDEKYFDDDRSKQVFKCYLGFLDRPSWIAFHDVLSPPSANCFDPDWLVMSGFDDRERPAATVELVENESTFPEQFVTFMAPGSRYYLIASGKKKKTEQKRHRTLIDIISGTFLSLPEKIGSVPKKVWADETSLVIVNKRLTRDERSALASVGAGKLRLVMRVGDSAASFRDALDLSLRLHPRGVRKLRIAERYANRMFLFSAPG